MHTPRPCLQRQAGASPPTRAPCAPTLRLLHVGGPDGAGASHSGWGSGSLLQQYPHWGPCSPEFLPLVECPNPTRAPALSRLPAQLQPAVWAQGVQCPPEQSQLLSSWFSGPRLSPRSPPQQPGPLRLLHRHQEDSVSLPRFRLHHPHCALLYFPCLKALPSPPCPLHPSFCPRRKAGRTLESLSGEQRGCEHTGYREE